MKLPDLGSEWTLTYDLSHCSYYRHRDQEDHFVAEKDGFLTCPNGEQDFVNWGHVKKYKCRRYNENGELEYEYSLFEETPNTKTKPYEPL